MTLIDKGDAFVFGYSKLDVMFGREDARRGAPAVPRDRRSPACAVLQETVTAIDPEARRVTTDAGVHEADVLVVALGADYDFDATPGLAEAGNEFYSVAGARAAGRDAADLLERARGHRRLRRAVQVPAGAERVRAAAARLADARAACATTARSRSSCRSERRCRRRPRRPRRCSRRSPSAASSSSPAGASPRSTRARSVAVLDDGSELPFDLFLGVPKHRAPDVVIASGMTEDGYVPVELADARDALPGRLRGRRRRHDRRAEGGRVRRGRRARGRRGVDRDAAGRRAAGRVRRPRLLLHRVRRRPRRPRRHRLPLGPDADRRLPRAVQRRSSPRSSTSARADAHAGSVVSERVSAGTTRRACAKLPLSGGCPTGRSRCD